MKKTIGDAKIPILGFGTWQLQGKECLKAVETALEVGYRHLDTADAYENHQEVAKAMKNSGVKREEIWLTTKLWRSDLQAKKTMKACDRVLQELQTDYLDLYLIHWPNKEVPIGETLEAMTKLQEEGKIRNIGVSNFTIHHLEDATIALKAMWQATGKEAKIITNQVEFHPTLNQESLKKFCNDNEIIVTAYSPIAQGYDLKLPVVKELAKNYGRSESQVVLNWLMQKEIVAIPRSSSRDHIEDNFKSLEWDLSAEDVNILDGLDEGYRIVEPEFNEFDY